MIKINHPILAKRKNIVLINKKRMSSSGFCHSNKPQSEITYKKLWKVTVILIVVVPLGTVSKELIKRLNELEIRGRRKSI